MSKLRKEIQTRSCVFTFSVKLEKWSFHVADFPRTGKKCTEIKRKVREERAELLFWFICKNCGVVAAFASQILNSQMLRCGLFSGDVTAPLLKASRDFFCKQANHTHRPVASIRRTEALASVEISYCFFFFFFCLCI